MSLSGFDPLIRQWFADHFERPTEPQLLGWREIGAGHDTLISAPTGSGKTLAAFLICLIGWSAPRAHKRCRMRPKSFTSRL